MNKREIGSTGHLVGEVGFGAMHLSISPERRPDAATSVSLLARIIDELEVDFIDTADAYCANEEETGQNERLIAEALNGNRRERVVVATKGGSRRPGGTWVRDGRPAHLISACERSLVALNTDRIDLYQLHAPDPDVPIRESVGALFDLQRAGKIRWVGVSNFSLKMVIEAQLEGEISTVQNRYSILHRDVDDDLISHCESTGITYLPWNPVGGRGVAPDLAAKSDALQHVAAERATSPYAIAIAWLLHRSSRMIPIPGSTRFDHFEELVRASGIELNATELALLDGTGAA